MRQQLTQGDALNIGVHVRLQVRKDLPNRRLPGKFRILDKQGNPRRGHGLGI